MSLSLVQEVYYYNRINKDLLDSLHPMDIGKLKKQSVSPEELIENINIFHGALLNESDLKDRKANYLLATEKVSHLTSHPLYIWLFPKGLEQMSVGNN